MSPKNFQHRELFQTTFTQQMTSNEHSFLWDLEHILLYITSNRGSSPQSINDFERLHIYNPHPILHGCIRKKIFIIQERSMIISKEVFLQKLAPYVPAHSIMSLESILNCFIISMETQLRELINGFNTEPSIFNKMNKDCLKINVSKRDVYLKTSLSRAWSQYKMRSRIYAHPMCSFTYFTEIFNDISLFMDKYGEHVIELDGCQSIPMVYESFLKFIDTI